MTFESNRFGRAFSLLALAAVAACSSSGDGNTDPEPNPAISLTLSGTSATVTAGNTHTVDATLTRSGGYSGTVAFTVDGAPTGVSGTVGTPSTSGTTTTAPVTISVATTTSPGTYNLTVRAAGSGVPEATAAFALTVEAAPVGGFTLTASPAAVSVSQGGSGNTTIAITRTGGFTGSVALTAAGAPTGLTATLNPVSTTGSSSTLTLGATASIAVGTHTLTIRGNATGQPERTTTVQVSITAGTGTSDEVVLDLSSCGLRPTWLAVQNGTGPWTVVTPTNNTFRFTVSADRGAVAFPFATTFNVHHLSRAELQDISGYFCGTAQPTKVATGTVAGMATNDFAQIWLGGGAGNASHPNTSFSISQIKPGSHALTAWRHNTIAEILGTPGNPDRGFVRRGIDVSNNGSVGLIDFEGPDSFTPASAALTIGGRRAESSLSHTMGYYTGSACHFAALYASAAPVTTTMTALGFPVSKQEANDFHFLTVTELTGVGTVPTGYTGGRTIQQVFALLTDRTVTLPTVMPRPAVTALAGPYRRLQAVIEVPEIYRRLVSITYNQTGSSRTVNLTATRDWFADGTLTLAMPDLSGLPGWNSVWAPPSDATGTWAVQATGNNLTDTNVCFEGAYVVQASELGTF
ncbi:MAG: COG1470 family protein [Gemmatimonadales bacterium]